MIKPAPYVSARMQATVTTYRVARILSVPRHYAAWVALCYFFTGRTKTYKIKDRNWRVTP